MYNLLHNVQVYGVNDTCGGTCETIGDLTDRLGPDILLVLRMEGQVLHRERAHLKVQGCH